MHVCISHHMADKAKRCQYCGLVITEEESVNVLQDTDFNRLISWVLHKDCSYQLAQDLIRVQLSGPRDQGQLGSAAAISVNGAIDMHFRDREEKR